MALNTSITSSKVAPQDIVEMIMALQKGLQEDTSGQMLMETKNMWSEWTEIMRIREQLIRRDIESLLNECETVEEEAETAVDPAMKRKVADLEEQLKIKEQQSKEVDQEAEALKAKKARSMKELEKLHSECQRAKEHASEGIAVIKSKAALLQNITQIKWLTDGPEDQVTGYVCNKSGVQDFSLNRKDHSSVFIADYLWGLMEPDW